MTNVSLNFDGCAYVTRPLVILPSKNQLTNSRPKEITISLTGRRTDFTV